MSDREHDAGWTRENNVGESTVSVDLGKPRSLTFDFGLALAMLRDGKRVARTCWSMDVYLTLQRPDANSKMTHPYIFVTSRFGLVPWVATQVELLTDDWILIGGER